jgi:hypothetical protein
MAKSPKSENATVQEPDKAAPTPGQRLEALETALAPFFGAGIVTALDAIVKRDSADSSDAEVTAG